MTLVLRDTCAGKIARSLYDWNLLKYDEECYGAFAESYYLKNRALAGRSDSDPYLVEFLGERDPDDPRRWSLVRKVLLTLELCLLTSSTYMSAAMWSPTVMGAAEAFEVSQMIAQLGTSLFLFGLGIGGMIFSPLGELPQIGKNSIYIPTLALFIVSQLPIVLSKSFSTVLVFRFITGVFASPTLSLGGGSMADIWSPQALGHPMIIYDGATAFATFGAPIIGNYANAYGGYQMPIWIIMWFSGAALIVFVLVVPETSTPNILYRRARRLRWLTANPKFHTQAERNMKKEPLGARVRKVVIKPFTLNFEEPVVLVLNLYLALIYSLLFAALESFRVVFVDLYGFSSGQEGLIFLAPLLGFFTGMLCYFVWYQKYQVPQFNEEGKLMPEERLIPAFVTAFACPISLFWFGWSAEAGIHWIMPVIGAYLLGVAACGVFAAVLNYFPDAYPDVSSTVLAGNNFFRTMIAGTFPVFITLLYERLGPGWASSIFGLLGCLFTPVPFVLYYYGVQIRMKSPNATKEFT